MQYNYFTKSILMVTMFALVSINHARGQNKAPLPGQVSGMVFNQFSAPLKGVKVFAVKSTDTVVTNEKGRFSIAAQKGSTLRFIAKGFNVAQLKVNRTDSIGVQLSDRYLKTTDKIDVLYNTVDADKNLGSVSTIYTNQLTTTPASLYTYALPGQLAGLYTQQASGFGNPQAGSPTTAAFLFNYVTSHNQTVNDNNGQFNLQVRGARDLFNSPQPPITIIDGVQREISSIDPETIESISVLKDGLSTILLGINSSNAVLLVTTKKAQAGRTLISFTAQAGIQQSLGLPTPLPAYQYAYLYNEASQNGGGQPLYNAADFEAYRNGSDPLGHPNVNWFNTILRKNAPIRSYKLNVTGGNAVARYSVSLNYFNQAGILQSDPSLSFKTNNNLSRYVLNSDINITASKNFNIDLQLFGRVQTITYPGQGSSGFTGILNTLYGLPNNAYPVYNPDGSFAGTNQTFYNNNLVAQSQYSGYTNTQNHDILTNLDLKYDLGNTIKGLSLRGKGNFAVNSQSFIDRSLQNAVYQLNPDGSYNVYGASRSQNNSFNNVSNSRYAYSQGAVAYNRGFGKNNFDALLFYDFRSILLTYDLPKFMQNRALQLAYNYDEKYFITGVFNNSGDDRYPAGHRFGWYYAGGIGWHMGKESFIKDNISWINSWKWRATYGNTGNDNIDRTGYFAYRQTFDSGSGGAYPQGTGYSNGGGYGESTGVINPNINPERAHKINIGTDINLFNNKLTLNADYFNERYYNLLKQRGNSNQLIGAGYPFENIGISRMTGGELTLTHQSNIGDFNYFVTGNASLLQTKQVYADELKPLYPWMARTGQPLSAIFGYTSLGFFQTQEEINNSATTVGYVAKPGDIKYKDLNGDGVIDQNDVSAIGGLKPLVFYGLNFGFNYKGFNVSILLQGVTNRQISFSQGDITQGFMGKGGFGTAPYGQAYTTILNRWTPETAATATSPRLTLGANPNNGAPSDFYVHSGNYVRLKNAEIGYTLPNRITSRINVSNLRFFVNGQNLLTVAGYKGIDPEVNGIAYPIQRVFNAGVSVKL
ncbi:SusC/RagA family TonB-linked outer membrane protein [Mucilaginibacter pallidiroseus]|uniref:SusC/RagA family TonB-linked outer membrane protein n=1 Tax=Mucilaginibacter pallidiroseus TaxID=2599295 RepID=A0A563TZM5_9SPHI|nr:SusC/RagA family TonB-linked outer membrane protein [Mucilaginibacter pallidiroseus]TWR24817.1 SusC/RagA family TonB-linked outer membrane protein [Mucilaginibacter pallidiroseus]